MRSIKTFRSAMGCFLVMLFISCGGNEAGDSGKQSETLAPLGEIDQASYGIVKKLTSLALKIGKDNNISKQQRNRLFGYLDRLSESGGVAESACRKGIRESREFFKNPRQETADGAEKGHYLTQYYLNLALENMGKAKE